MLVVLFRTEEDVWKSLRNLGERVQVAAPRGAQHLRRACSTTGSCSRRPRSTATIARLSASDDGDPTPTRWRRVKDPRDIIIRPVVSEKSYEAFDGNVYTFVVAHDANKIEIRKAVEELFATRVEKVHTINRKGKRKRNRTSGAWTHPRDRKRAIVTLAAGDEHIDIFGS